MISTKPSHCAIFFTILEASSECRLRSTPVMLNSCIKTESWSFTFPFLTSSSYMFEFIHYVVHNDILPTVLTSNENHHWNRFAVPMYLGFLTRNNYCNLRFDSQLTYILLRIISFVFFDIPSLITYRSMHPTGEVLKSPRMGEEKNFFNSRLFCDDKLSYTKRFAEENEVNWLKDKMYLIWTRSRRFHIFSKFIGRNSCR